jgi:oligopeptide transport system ATP-binding protein
MSARADCLQVDALTVSFGGGANTIAAVKEVSFRIAATECVGIVGESGSGKTQLFTAIMGLLPQHARTTGSVRFQGRELLGIDTNTLNQFRGREMSMVFQDPMTSLTPHLRIGEQLAEVLNQHEHFDAAAARQRALQMLERVQITRAESRLRQYPHELSGGMRQRIMIAMACLCRPSLLIADEPTTALDTTVQAQVLSLLQSMRQELGTAVALITHDFALLAGLADRVLVMYAGRVVEEAAATELFDAPLHPYSAGLLSCVPRWSDARLPRLPSIPGQPPEARLAVTGCAFAPRCSRVQSLCQQQRPELSTHAGTRRVACHFPLRHESVS